jgi:deoxyribose-phosphate aldolase
MMSAHRRRRTRSLRAWLAAEGHHLHRPDHLNGDDTAGRVQRLCAKAKSPVRADLLAALGMADRRITTGAVCVYHRFVATAVEASTGTGIPVAAVSTGFPAGLVAA